MTPEIEIDSEGDARPEPGTSAVARRIDPSARAIEIALRFGVPLSPLLGEATGGSKFPIRPGTLTLITGPSGSGKTRLLTRLARRYPTARLVDTLPFPCDVALVDAVAPSRPVDEALGVLTACGLGEPMLWIRPYDELSAGEQFRARLARAVSVHHRDLPNESRSACVPLLCDEFGAVLHRRLAQALAFNLRKLVSRERLALVVATSRDDLETDLQPDTVVRLGGSEPTVETDRPVRASRISFAARLRIERGTPADYAAFAPMHYRGGTPVGFVDKIFVCREGTDGAVLGVVVYAHPTLELKPRNDVTGGHFCCRPDRLNRHMRLLKRLIVHPDVRGCGIGHWLVRRTLPLVGTQFVECLAAMAAVNPVFEKAGMRRAGSCRPSKAFGSALAQLEACGIDPLSADFVSQVCRRPGARRIVAEAVLKWYRATSGQPTVQFARQSPADLGRIFRQLAGSEPVYYLWSADAAGWEMIDRQSNETSAGREVKSVN